MDAEVGTCENMGWTQDGLILTVSTSNGHLFSFLTKTPLVTAFYESKWIRLSSLRSLTISDVSTSAEHTMDIHIEPQIIGLGPRHVVVGRNNYLWFFGYDGQSLSVHSSKALLGEKQYVGTVESVQLTKTHVAVLTEGKIQVHSLDFSNSG